MTSVHVSPMPIPELGLVVLRIDCSGGTASQVSVLRRPAAGTTLTGVRAPAVAGTDDGLISTVSGRAVVVDTTAPLDEPVVYLAAPAGGTPTVASAAVTLTSSDGLWRLGDPQRPHLDITMGMAAPAPCSTARASIMCSVSTAERQAQSLLTVVDDRASALHTARPTGLESYTVTISTRTDADREAVGSLLDPGGALLLRSPAGYGLGSRYVSVRQSAQERMSLDLRKSWRRFTLTVQGIDGVDGDAYAPVGFRFVDACAAYATYTAAAAAGVSWSSAATGVLGGELPAAIRTMAEGVSAGRTFAQQTARGFTFHQRSRDGA